MRETRPAARSEVVRDAVRAQSRPIPLQRDAEPGTIVVARVDDIDVHRPRPVADAKIGPQVAAARQRARLSIDTLSERTRIRPHVLECIEVDDFEPCGGDFYARGHLRTLARTFGLDAQELVASLRRALRPAPRSRPSRSSRPSWPPASAAACAPPSAVPAGACSPRA